MIFLLFFAYISKVVAFEKLSDVCTNDICQKCSRFVNLLRRSHTGCQKVLNLKENVRKYLILFTIDICLIFIVHLLPRCRYGFVYPFQLEYYFREYFTADERCFGKAWRVSSWDKSISKAAIFKIWNPQSVGV